LRFDTERGGASGTVRRGLQGLLLTLPDTLWLDLALRSEQTLIESALVSRAGLAVLGVRVLPLR